MPDSAKKTPVAAAEERIVDPCIDPPPAIVPPRPPRWFIHTEEGLGHIVLDLALVESVCFNAVFLQGREEALRFDGVGHVAAMIAQALAIYRGVVPVPESE